MIEWVRLLRWPIALLVALVITLAFAENVLCTQGLATCAG